MAEQVVIRINVEETVNQIVKLTQKIDQLNDTYKGYGVKLKELTEDEKGNAEEIKKTLTLMLCIQKITVFVEKKLFKINQQN